MPMTVRKQGDKYRIVEADTGDIAMNAAGTPVDGGGHRSEAKAKSQVRAINMYKHSGGKK